MGQVCSGEKPEARKAGPFGDGGGDGADDAHLAGTNDGDMLHSSQQQQNQHQQHSQQSIDEGGTGAGAGGQGPAKEDAERFKAYREEQSRLEMIVSNAGRGMVAVRSMRGSTGYYDQGFAAALAQHLEQTTQFPKRLEVRLPAPSSSSVYSCLHQPQWEGVSLGPGGGLAGCQGVDPMRYMDNLAESVLDSVVPTKQQLFAGASPMVENLL